LRQTKRPVRFVVHQRERAVASERDDAVAHAADDVPEEPIVGRRPGTWRRSTLGTAIARRRRCPTDTRFASLSHDRPVDAHECSASLWANPMPEADFLVRAKTLVKSSAYGEPPAAQHNRFVMQLRFRQFWAVTSDVDCNISH